MVQAAGVEGDHNTVVQIEGDGNTVVLGRPFLKLTRFDTERGKPLSDARLLIPARRAIPLLGREEELKSLLDFVQDDAPNDIRVRVLVGGGGSGKTRLALELCDRIKDTWLAGFASTAALERFFKQQDAGAWGWQKPTLIVLDYAAAQAEVLQKWLPELQDRATAPQHPLRILLLERHADPQNGWHQRVFNPGGWQSAGLRDLLEPPEPVRIRPLFEVADRMGVISAVLQLVRPELIPLLSPDLLEAQFQQTAWGGDPLYLAMAALTMAQRGDVAALQLGRTDLALEVAGHEMSRLAQVAQSHGVMPDLVHHLAACITLIQGLPRLDALDLIRVEKAAIGFETGDPAKVLDVLHETLANGESVSPVQPDLVGEALLLKALRRPDRAESIARLFAKYAGRVSEILVRLVQDFSDVSNQPQEWLSSLIDDPRFDMGTLDQIHAALPPSSVVLKQINLQLAQRLVALTAQSETEVRARFLVRLALALHASGQFELAIEEEEKAVEMYRNLVSQQPGYHENGLAWALQSLSVMLGKVGRLDEALVAATRATELSQYLAEQYPNVYLSYLAAALNSLGSALSELGRNEEALEKMQRATALYCDLVHDNYDAYAPYLAGVQCNLARLFIAVGRQDQALTAAKESVELFHDLARQRPDSYTAACASALNNLAMAHDSVGQSRAGMEAAQKATDLYSNLARSNPAAYTAILALTTNTLAHLCAKVGNHGGALAVARSAEHLWADLAEKAPEAHLHNWALSLTNLARMLYEAKEYREGLDVAERSVNIFSTLSDSRLDLYKPDWAMALNNFAMILISLDQRDKATEVAQLAVELREELVRHDQRVYLSDYAHSLIVQAEIHSKCGRKMDAVSRSHEALRALNPAYISNPKIHVPQMLFSMERYVVFCQSAQIKLDAQLLSPLMQHLQYLASKGPTQ